MVVSLWTVSPSLMKMAPSQVQVPSNFSSLGNSWHFAAISTWIHSPRWWTRMRQTAWNLAWCWRAGAATVGQGRDFWCPHPSRPSWTSSGPPSIGTFENWFEFAGIWRNPKNLTYIINMQQGALPICHHNGGRRIFWGKHHTSTFFTWCFTMHAACFPSWLKCLTCYVL